MSATKSTSALDLHSGAIIESLQVFVDEYDENEDVLEHMNTTRREYVESRGVDEGIFKLGFGCEKQLQTTQGVRAWLATL